MLKKWDISSSYKTYIYGKRLKLKNGDRQIPIFFPISPLRTLNMVRSTIGMGVYASSNENFAAAHFTRDSVAVSEDMLDVDPKIAEETIITAVRFQALENNKNNDARPGGYHHEHRDLKMIQRLPSKNKNLKEFAKARLLRVSSMWGGNEHEVTYYGGADATPKVIRLVGLFLKQYPKSRILNKKVKHTKGSYIKVRESIVLAIKYIFQCLLESDLGLVEYQTRNPLGLKNQYWKDSATSLLFSDGRLANHNNKIAEIGIQGLVYDSLFYVKEFLTYDEINEIFSKERLEFLLDKPFIKESFTKEEYSNILSVLNSETNYLDLLLLILQKQTLNKFWMKDKKFFSPALDRDPENGKVRQIDTLTSNPSVLLNSVIFDNLSDKEKQYYLMPTISKLMGSEFITDVGIRCAALKHFNLLDFYDYHWSGTSWPIDSHTFAKGLAHQKLSRLAEQVWIRIINGLFLAGSMVEFFNVDFDGRVNFDSFGRQPYLKVDSKEPKVYTSTIKAPVLPEANQAWTASCANYIQRYFKQKRKYSDITSWQKDLETKLLVKIPKAYVLCDEKDFLSVYPTQYYFIVDTESGEKLAAKWNREWYGLKE